MRHQQQHNKQQITLTSQSNIPGRGVRPHKCQLRLGTLLQCMVKPHEDQTWLEFAAVFAGSYRVWAPEVFAHVDDSSIYRWKAVPAKHGG
eukprot:3847163-Amphidinium_carterae.2